jgi:hypothetical protein
MSYNPNIAAGLFANEGLAPQLIDFYKKRPPYTLAGFDITTHKFQSPQWQVEMISLGRSRRQGTID